MRSQKILGFALACLVLIAIAAIPLAAQMDHGQMHTAAQGGMQHSMMATEQMMKSIHQMMSNASTMMQDLTTMHAGTAGHEQHDPMMQSMQGMLDQMKQFQGQMQEGMKDPAMMQNKQAMKSMNEVCQNLEKMVSAFQAMTKNMTQMMKATAAQK
jgi:hypothetical protein